MIYNIVDRRERKFRWLKVFAIVESTWHDNTMPDGDTIGPGPDDVHYEERPGITVSEAVVWAQTFAELVTLYLYDEAGPKGRVVTPEISN